MKRKIGILALLLSVSLLAACGGQKGPFTQYDPPADETMTTTTVDDNSGDSSLDTAVDATTSVSALFRIVDGAEDGSLLLARPEGGAGDIYRLGTSRDGLKIYLDGETASSDALEDGMAIRITWDGSIMETYPAQFSGVTKIEAWSIGSEENPGGGYYDLCGLYLQVLNDLWEKDPALNEGKSMIGLDLTRAPGSLTDSEKSALAWRFGELHNTEVYLTTFDQLKEEGALTEQALENGNSFYTWEDGCLFSIAPHETDETEIYSLPVLRFDAEKYVGPLAAYYFYDCSVAWPEFGTWSEYTIGAEMIS